MNRTKNNLKRVPNPIEDASVFSKWSFWWTRPIFRKGRNRPLSEEELYEQKSSLENEKLTSRLIGCWEDERKQKEPSVMRMIFRVYGMSFIPVCVIYSIFETSIRAIQPMCLGGLLDYFAEGQVDITKTAAYVYASGIILCSVLSTLAFHPFLFYMFEVGARVRIACSGLIYRKSLKIPKSSTSGELSGRAINILSNDMSKLELAFQYFHDLWKGPVEAVLFGTLMYREIGLPAVIGIAFIALFIPLQAWAAKRAAYYRRKAALTTDVRVKLMNEIIQGIQVIKMYAWEKSFAKIISDVRKKEIAAIRGSTFIYAAQQCTPFVSKFAVFLSLVSYVLLGDVFTSKKVFTVMSWFDALNDSLFYWSLGITYWSEAYVSTRRIKEFLMEEEGDFKSQVGAIAKDKGVVFENVTLSWHKDSKPALVDINTKILDGELVGVMGPVGGGKSTFLNAILGELRVTKGHANVGGSISYAPQSPWLFEGTVRDNILFTEPVDEDRYQQVVHVCDLERDLLQLPMGDSTIVGERGISLSGGQKARVSLARAVYKKADIYLFDDPLSAVDAQVGKHIYEKCIKSFLGDKTRLLVTHQVQYLQSLEHVILISSGRIEAEGSAQAIQQGKGFEFVLEAASSEPDPINANESSYVKPMKDQSAEMSNDRKEFQAEGSVKLGVYKSYFKSLSNPVFLVAVVLLFMASRAMLTGVDYFISQWVNWEESVNSKTNNDSRFYNDLTPDEKRIKIIIFYTLLLFSTLILFLLRTYGFFIACLRISLRLHNKLFHGITRAYMYFFNTNPSGRILNRFSKDIGMTDVILPQALLDSVAFFVDTTAVFIIVAIANYWLLIPAVIMALILYWIMQMYINTSRSLKRLESMARSPIYSQTNQTFQGIEVIRAWKAEKVLEKEFYEFQNANTSILYLYIGVNRAFAFWTDMLCTLYIFAVVFSFLILEKQFYGGDVGLAITQSMSMVMMCQWGMRQTAELENQMTSVERIIEYADQPSEAQLESDTDRKPPKDWPHEGCLQFENLKFKYSEKDDYVLKGLTFDIKPNEKIGIVGRTGAGKSSIIQSIFRLAMNEGQIRIDGKDTATIGLHDLRSKISIIPQESILFSGSMRYNLDPFNAKSDGEIWAALKDVSLKELVSSMEGGLNGVVTDGGANFSMGQRQLICLARAILKNNKIIILDEATANVDPETDKLIQSTIRTKFANCTVLTIAHRLQSIMDSDRVMVMDDGRAVELAHPHELLQIPDGYFRKLVSRTGGSTAEILMKLAKQSYENLKKTS